MPAVELLQTIARHPLLAVLDEKTRAAVVRASTQVSYRGKRAIIREGDPPEAACFLLAGSVRVFHRDAAGNEVTVKLLRAPALFGEMEVLAARPFLELVYALEPSEILRVPATVLRKLVATQRAFAAALVGDLALRLCIATANERALAFSDVDTRAANLLLDYVALAGAPEGTGFRITIPVTGESMSRDLAVSRKSMVRALRKLTDAGIVAKRGSNLFILDHEALRARGSGGLSITYDLHTKV